MRQELGPLGAADFLTKGELDSSLNSHFQALVRQFYRADKTMRIPLVQGTASGSALSIISTVGPEQGYAWDIGLIGVAGLTSGTTPDVVNMFFGGGPQVPWWQFNGNNYVYTFSRGQMVMLPGETITLTSVGTFASTALITLFGLVRTEAPAEKLSSVLT